MADENLIAARSSSITTEGSRDFLAFLEDVRGEDYDNSALPGVTLANDSEASPSISTGK